MRSAHLGAAYAAEGVVHAVELHLQLALVAHVHEVAAAAAAEVGAIRLDALGRGGEALLPPAEHSGLCDLHDAHAPGLAGQGARHEHGAALYPAHARALGGEAGHGGLVYFVFLQIVHVRIVTRGGVLFNGYQKICNSRLHMLSYFSCIPRRMAHGGLI